MDRKECLHSSARYLSVRVTPSAAITAEPAGVGEITSSIVLRIFRCRSQLRGNVLAAIPELVKHFPPPALLRVRRIQNFVPRCGSGRVGPEPVGSEEIHTSALDVVGVKEAFVSAGANQAPQPALPFGQR